MNKAVASLSRTAQPPKHCISKRKPIIDARKRASRPLYVNNRGLFDWNHWDGRLWETDQLEFFKLATRARQRQTSEELSKLYHEKLIENPDYILNRFWMSYYTADLGALDAMLVFHRPLSELQTIIFLLRTSPIHIRNRFLTIIDSLMDLSWELSLLNRKVLRVRFILSYQHWNPLRFMSEARIFRISMAGIDARIARDTAIKMIRKERKLQHLRQNRHLRELTSLFGGLQNHILIETAQKMVDATKPLFRELYNQYPQMWVVEALAGVLRRVRRRFFYNCQALGVITYFHFASEAPQELQERRTDAFRRMRKSLQRANQGVLELEKESKELSALRYFRLQYTSPIDLQAEISRCRSFYTNWDKATEGWNTQTAQTRRGIAARVARAIKIQADVKGRSSPSNVLVRYVKGRSPSSNVLVRHV